MHNLHAPETDRLFRAVLELKTIEECYDFFEDLCTVKELRDLSQRLEVAALLREGDSYQTIAQKTLVSSATIGRVNRALRYGSGGYRRMLSRLDGEEKSE